MELTLGDIEKARQAIAPYLHPTPLLPSPVLNRTLGKEIWLKCEHLQFTGSFKFRGATNCVLGNLAAAKKAGVVAASAGNHAQGVAAICARLGIGATIVMPKPTPFLKVANTKRHGANVELVGTVYDEAYEHAKSLADEKGMVLVHPFRDPLVMAGQGTVGLELLEAPDFGEVEAVVLSVGGGGLMSGVATALRAKRKGLKIYGVTAKSAPAVYDSYRTGSAQTAPVAYTLAEGVATKRADARMVERLRALVDDMFTIPEESIANAISLLAEHGKMVVEGAGALPLAAVMDGCVKEKKVALVLSGGNIDLFSLSSVLQRGLAHQGRLARLEVSIPDRPGGLLAVTQILAEENANILQIEHQRESLRHPIGETLVELLLGTRGEDHSQALVARLEKSGYVVRRDV